ncbi:hypothetical protein CLIM01_09139 [Colletotrichum limetticola]|uniref:Uncharacterized protein n=1 Tax=Colletotrichum limetticola TaxID=1209924 RepID=A0ABQ9PPT3_9PEZI|nr:hypothetical protein CLIM01_09139 [Colletotrichum limetticola]
MRSPLMWTVAGGGSANFASKDEEGEDSLGGCAKHGMGCWSAKATNPVTLYTVGQGPAWWVVPSLGFLLKVCRKSMFYLLRYY